MPLVRRDRELEGRVPRSMLVAGKSYALGPTSRFDQVGHTNVRKGQPWIEESGVSGRRSHEALPRGATQVVHDKRVEDTFYQRLAA